MEVKDKLRIDPGQQYKDRVAAVRNQLPHYYRQIIIQHYPEYDTAKGYTLITHVVRGKSVCTVLTDILERIASGELKLKQAA